MLKKICVSIIIPAYNEERTIIEVLEKVREQTLQGVTFEVIVVDDGSKDQTVNILKANPNLYSRLLVSEKNGGKGAAVRKGLEAATGDYILFQDADLEYDPSDYASLVFPVQNYKADVVIGSRLLASKYSRVFYFWHQIGNKFITTAFNILNNTTFSDTYSCYLLFKRSLLEPRELISNSWDQQAEILSIVVNRGRIFYETPISYHGRTYDEGKKIRSYHVVPVLWMMVKKWFLLKFFSSPLAHQNVDQPDVSVFLSKPSTVDEK